MEFIFGKSRSSKHAPSSAVRRLGRDYYSLKKDPLPYIYAEPEPSNMLVWHYVLRGPPDTLYNGGLYHGKLIFTEQFPFKAPGIVMCTPNGRFRPNTKLCLSISDFHQELWNPAWCVGAILQGILSFMLEDAPTVGSILTTDGQKRSLALKSFEYNIKQKIILDLFPELADEMEDTLVRRQTRLILTDPVQAKLNRKKYQ